ncbi:MAG: protein of unknown function and CofD [Deltaproteobacteria bacterium]|nr:protein of unknown function and CofD [Deltaproteobacteria bacterium]
MSAAQTPLRSGLVFLSGGSALTGLARTLAEARLSATHIISVFDDGGSAGRLRDACGGIAIGDIRKRLIAIGNRSAAPSRRVIDLLQSRLPADGSACAARTIVEGFACGTSDALNGVSPQTAAEISLALQHVLSATAADFEWRDASIGNLILAGRYRQLGDWAPALAWAHGTVSACGVVMPVSTEPADLSARLANGRWVHGQSVLTNEITPIDAPIAALELHQSGRWPAPARVSAHGPALREIQTAAAIIYSWGSFYTSVACSLLVQGIAPALAASPAPKVLLLNPFTDAETVGKQAFDLVRELCGNGGGEYGRRAGSLLTHVLALRVAGNSKPALYDVAQRAQLESLGVQVVEVHTRGIPRGRELLEVMEHLFALAAIEWNDTSDARG